MSFSDNSALLRPVLGLLVFVSLLADPVLAQDPDSTRIAELERRIEAVSRELDRLRLGEEAVADSSVAGFGAGASKVYSVDQGVSIGGYGEFLYENYSASREDGAPAGRLNRADALRAIIYLGYRFNDQLLFNSEIEVEHAKEIFLEFAYLEYRLARNFGVRAGMLLAPVGLVNELHEPPVYLGTQRSLTESRIIPTTWRENGIGLFGSVGDVDWRAYLMNSFDGAGFSAAGLRGGRQKGAKALAEDLGLAVRADWTGMPGLLVGASAYIGDTGQGAILNDQRVGGQVRIWDLHADYQARGWNLQALLAQATVKDAAQLNQLNGLAGAAGVGSRMRGWYVQAGYDVLNRTRTPHQLIPYLRHERVNTQHEVTEGALANPANDLRVTSVGFSWKPVTQVAFKVDYQLHGNHAETGVDQWNISLGWLF